MTPHPRVLKLWRTLGADFSLLAAALIVLSSLLAFVEIADDVAEGDTRTFDERAVLLWRDPHDPAHILGPPIVGEVMRDLTALGGVAVVSLIGVLVGGFLILAGRWRTLLFVVVAVGGGTVLSLTLKSFFARPRPQLVPHLSEVMTSSFPSGHSTLSAVVYLTLASLLARLVEERTLKIFIVCTALLLAVLVGVSRVVLGVHYPSDVVAGWLVGVLWSMTCWAVMRWLQRRHVVDAPADVDVTPSPAR